MYIKSFKIQFDVHNMYWTCNLMNNLSSYCGFWCKNECFWQRFTCTILLCEMLNCHRLENLGIKDEKFLVQLKPKYTSLGIVKLTWLHLGLNFLIQNLPFNLLERWLANDICSPGVTLPRYNCIDPDIVRKVLVLSFRWYFPPKFGPFPVKKISTL